ncbi:MAG TPA: ribosome biogenesis GTPase Der [Devosiaceae bacterium]|nr:ribosome biogenesis GTPase Der [Devosiaceae bacterium]
MGVTVAIVGRPNVGKSTLFNRLVGKRLALVDDTPGVTRDRREGEARIGDLKFKLIDTAGFEDVTGDSLPARMRRQTEEAVRLADLVLLMIDARAGVTPLDAQFAQLLRKSGRPVALIANKAESRAAEAGLLEAYSLGFGEAVPVSAEHGIGLSDLHALVAEAVEAARAEEQAGEQPSPGLDELLPETDVDIKEGETPNWDPTRQLSMAIIGRPNAGKSTLINTMLGAERMLTGPEAGITRDSIAVNWDWQGRGIRLIDTAGIRKRARVRQKLEKLSVADALRAIRYAEIVVLLLDAGQPFEKQDLQLADLVEREGRALVIAVNKWDLVKQKSERLAELREMADRLLPQLRGVSLVTISGLKGTNLDRLMEAVLKTEKTWNARVPTARLNRWLEEVTARHTPPAVSGRRLKLRYMTQAKTRPPSFVLFCSRPDALPAAYQRFLVNGLREDFGLDGVPLRLWVRGGENPYVNKGGKRR